MSSIKLSVIIPFFNPGIKLKKTIDSVLEAPRKEVELIVLNDGSTDDFDYLNLCSLYKNVIYKRQENKGVSVARNEAVNLASGKYLLFLDSDDWLTQTAISDFFKLLSEKNESFDLVFSWSRIFDLKTGESEDWKRYHKMTFVGRTIDFSNLAGTFFILKTLFLEVGGYNPKIRFSENLDLMIRVLSLGDLRIHYLKVITVNFGNSLDPNTRNGKFPQGELLQSLEMFYEANQTFFKENPRFSVNVISRIIVAMIFLGRKETLNSFLQKLKELGSTRYKKFLWLSRIPSVYRVYLASKGFRA